MSGIQVPPSTTPPQNGSAFARLGLLMVLVVAFTAGLWWMFGPKPGPKPRGLTASASLAEPPPQGDTAEAPLMASAPDKPAHLKMDTELSATPPPAPAPALAPQAAAPPPETRSAEPIEPADLAPEPAPAPAPKPKRKPAAPEPPPPEAPVAAAEAPVAAPRSGVTPTVPRTPKATEVYAEAQRAMQKGDTKAAEAGLIEALAIDPQLHPAREDLGTLRIRQGRFDEAERNVRVGLESDPTWVGYRRLMGRLELARRNPTAALDALARDPPAIDSDTEYHALLASAYQRLNRHDDASRTYRALADVQPDNASWWAGYAMSRDALGDVPGALAGYARARQIGGLDARVLEHINRRTAVLQSAS